MKKYFIPFTAIFITCACSSSSESNLQSRIDSLEKKLATTYKPGFGEFMSSIQVHHAKLWFAGKEQNWELAKFELDEIIETKDAIEQFQMNREESKKIDMLKPALTAVYQAILRSDTAIFRSSYLTLTAACNDCHKAVGFGFNIVKVPDSPPFSNQAFK